METSKRFDLSGKTALITGATRGIGLAIAKGLAQHGARINITGRKKETVVQTATKLVEEKYDAAGIVCHQGDPSAIEALFEKMEKQDRLPDIAVINAATNPTFGPLMKLDLAAWHKIVDVNITGGLLTAQHAAQQMLINEGGSIVFISSVAGVEPIPGLGAYGISKSAMLGMMRALAQELGHHGIRVNAIAPGLIETSFSQALFENQTIYQRLVRYSPLDRHGQPEDIVGTVVYLVSEASAYVTGQTFIVDGGHRM